MHNNVSLRNRNAPCELRRGQAVIEVLIALLLTVLVSLAASEVMGSTVRGGAYASSKTGAAFLAYEATEAVRAISTDWVSFSELMRSAEYHPIVADSRWEAAPGSETISLNNAAYTRSFSLLDVYRDEATGDIVSVPGYRDPSTLRVTVRVNWKDTFETPQEFTQAFFLTRFRNDVFPQTDWSAGAMGETVVGATTTTSGFATSSDVDFSTVPGSVRLAP